MRSVGRLIHKLATRSEKKDDREECLLKCLYILYGCPQVVLTRNWKNSSLLHICTFAHMLGHAMESLVYSPWRSSQKDIARVTETSKCNENKIVDTVCCHPWETVRNSDSYRSAETVFSNNNNNNSVMLRSTTWSIVLSLELKYHHPRSH